MDRRGWLRCLEKHCAELQGHRVVWRKDADPYQKQVISSAMRARDIAERWLINQGSQKHLVYEMQSFI